MVPIIVASALLVPWQRLPAWPQAILPLSYFVVSPCSRRRRTTPSVFDRLPSILPLASFAIYGTSAELAGRRSSPSS